MSRASSRRRSSPSTSRGAGPDPRPPAREGVPGGHPEPRPPPDRGGRRRGPRPRGDRPPAVRADRSARRRAGGLLGAGAGKLTCAPGSGVARLARIAGSRHGAHRREHVVRRGSPGRRQPRDPGLGTGIRALGLALDGSAPSRIDILLSHLHLDHLEGLGFFARCGSEDGAPHLGPPSPMRSLSDRISQYLSPPLFPVRLAEVPARLELHDAPDEPWMLGSATSRPGRSSTGTDRRVPDRGRRTEPAYLTDHEPALAVDLSSADASGSRGSRLPPMSTS